MLASLRSTWERISALGIRDEPTGERRRIRLTNQSLVIGTVSCGAFAIGYFLAGSAYRAPMIANLVGVVCLACGFALTLQGVAADKKKWEVVVLPDGKFKSATEVKDEKKD